MQRDEYSISDHYLNVNRTVTTVNNEFYCETISVCDGNQQSPEMPISPTIRSYFLSWGSGGGILSTGRLALMEFKEVFLM